MHLDALIDLAERGLRETYSVRLAHVLVRGQGWTWHIDVEIIDGGIVHAGAATRGACVRAAHVALTDYISRFGGWRKGG